MSRNSKCFPRIRPYINTDFLDFILENKDASKKHGDSIRPAKNEFFFSSGRGSLKWILSNMRELKQKSLRVGIQAFTCQVVPQAILESNNMPVFFDISSEYYTTLISDIDFDNIDVLILTHLFGIPNPDYFKICEICKKKQIIVIDDLALTFRSSIGGEGIGYASDATFYSFGFDKPVSCYSGGLLRVNKESLIDQLQDSFDNLPEESSKRQINDLMKLRVFYELFDKKNYVHGFFYDIDNHFLPIINFLRFRGKRVCRVLFFLRKLFNYTGKLFFHKDQGKLNPIEMIRMGQLKYDYLTTLFQLYPTVQKKRLFAANKAKEKMQSIFDNILFPIIPDNIELSWHRLPMLAPQDKRHEIIRWGKVNNIEIGAYNWSVLSFEPFKELNILKPESFPISNLVKNQILNLPIWEEQIWEF